jgi:DNA-binding NarL/FixJ family response regulator
VPKILIIDEHGASRHGLRYLIEQRILDARVYESNDLLNVPGLEDTHDYFDLVLIDADASKGHTRQSLEDSHAIPPSTRVAVISVAHSKEEVLSCLADGYCGLIDKHDLDDEIILALNDILGGRIYVPAWIADGIVARVPHLQTVSATLSVSLTPRQQSVLSLIAQGLSNKQIAHRLQISEGTAKIHIAAMLRALGVRNRAEAVAKSATLVRRLPALSQSPTIAPKASSPMATSAAPTAAPKRVGNNVRKKASSSTPKLSIIGKALS